MICTVVVNGNKTILIPKDQQDIVYKILFGERLLDYQCPKAIHKKICMFLRIGRFVPNINFRHFALISNQLDFYDNKKSHMMTLSSWLECAYCHFQIDPISVGFSCSNCGQIDLQNFKYL